MRRFLWTVRPRQEEQRVLSGTQAIPTRWGGKGWEWEVGVGWSTVGWDGVGSYKQMAPFFVALFRRRRELKGGQAGEGRERGRGSQRADRLLLVLVLPPSLLLLRGDITDNPVGAAHGIIATPRPR